MSTRDDEPKTVGTIAASEYARLREAEATVERVKALLAHDYPSISLSAWTPDQEAAIAIANAALRKAFRSDLLAALRGDDEESRDSLSAIGCDCCPPVTNRESR